jgi:hypothetical protein
VEASAEGDAALVATAAGREAAVAAVAACERVLHQHGQQLKLRLFELDNLRFAEEKKKQ